MLVRCMTDSLNTGKPCWTGQKTTFHKHKRYKNLRNRYFSSFALVHSIVIFEVCRDLIHPIVVASYCGKHSRWNRSRYRFFGALSSPGCAVFGWWFALRVLHAICCSSFGIDHFSQDGWPEFQLLATVVRGWVRAIIGHRGMLGHC